MKLTEQFQKAEKKNNLEEAPCRIKNIGWSIGNACPYHCSQCYSLSVRKSGKNLTKENIDRIIDQIVLLNPETVNIGGNEPWYTSGLNGESLLPYIIESLSSKNIKVGITTSGITLVKLKEQYPKIINMINDIDISLDSPIAEEHNNNRKAKLFPIAIRALEICVENNIEHSIIMCAMKWNFTLNKVKALIELAKKYDANIRFNMLKPVKKEHINEQVDAKIFYEIYNYLLNNCETVDIGEPRLHPLMKEPIEKRCSCGSTSLRINSITPNGEVPVSPCVYMHDYKVGNLLQDSILDIIEAEPFKEFRRRTLNYNEIKGCEKCEYKKSCGGGCAASAYLTQYWKTGKQNIYTKEENCYKDIASECKAEDFSMNSKEHNLVHIDYLCTWIGKLK